MKNLLENKVTRLAFYICAFILITIFGLWSWNTLAELFSGPQAQYKHVVAAISLLLITRLFLFQHTNKCSHSLNSTQVNA